MATRNNNLGKGSLLWGASFNPVTYIPTDDPNSIVEAQLPVAGATLNMDGSAANADAAGDNAYMPVPMALCFDHTVANHATTYRIDGKDQFGQDTIEDVSLTAQNAVYTNHCWSFVRTITVLATDASSTERVVVGWIGNAVLDCPIPLPFYLKDPNHIYGLAVEAVQYDAVHLAPSKVYNTAVLLSDAGAPANLTATEILVVSINLINGAQAVY